MDCWSRRELVQGAAELGLVVGCGRVGSLE
jgi:hypothetical protein